MPRRSEQRSQKYISLNNIEENNTTEIKYRVTTHQLKLRLIFISEEISII